MSWQLWDPPAYYVQVQVQQEIQIRAAQQQASTETQDSYFRRIYDRPWNTLQSDGRINMGNSTSASVSPYSEHFRSQIEPNIWCVVQALYLKGYLTVSSCQGHRSNLAQELDVLFVRRSEPYVSFAVHRELAHSIHTQCTQVVPKWCSVELAHTMSNTHATASTQPDGTARVRLSKDTRAQESHSEALGLNMMFQRNYTEWSYITLRINPWKRLNLAHWLRTQREPKLLKQLAHTIKNLDSYSR
jgi:hypothetical protein